MLPSSCFHPVFRRKIQSAAVHEARFRCISMTLLALTLRRCLETRWWYYRKRGTRMDETCRHELLASSVNALFALLCPLNQSCDSSSRISLHGVHEEFCSRQCDSPATAASLILVIVIPPRHFSMARWRCEVTALCASLLFASESLTPRPSRHNGQNARLNLSFRRVDLLFSISAIEAVSVQEWRDDGSHGRYF